MLYDPDKFNPETMFIKRRRGKMYMFDKQIRNWRRTRKKKGMLKDSKHVAQGMASVKNAIKRNFFE
jgi:hypothetical protein